MWEIDITDIKFYYLGSNFRQSPDDVGEFRLEKREEVEIRFDHIHPMTALTVIGK